MYVLRNPKQTHLDSILAWKYNYGIAPLPRPLLPTCCHMLRRKKRRKQERQEKKATRLDRRNKFKGPAATEQSRHIRQEKDHVESPPVKKKRGLTTAHHEDKGIEKEKKELKRLKKLLSIRGGKEKKFKFIHT